MNEEDGFHLGIRDQMSCFSLSCVIVFYHVYPEEVSDLVVHPETIAPPIGRQSPLIEVITECVPGAIPERSEVRLSCSQGGVWTAITGSGCRCEPGLIQARDGKSCKVMMILDLSKWKIGTDHTHQTTPITGFHIRFFWKGWGNTNIICLPVLSNHWRDHHDTFWD